MKVSKLYEELNKLYPSSLSCSWDNDGIMACTDLNREISRVLVSLDATLECLKYAHDNNFDLVLVHHPLIFKPIKALDTSNAVVNRVAYAIKNDITVISLHTRLDAGNNGVNDILAEKLHLTKIEPFGDDECSTLGRIGYSNISDPIEFSKMVKKELGGNVTRYIVKPVNKVALVGGSALEYAQTAIALGCDTFITGEGGYNHCIDAAESGINIILAGHYSTENPVCANLYNVAMKITNSYCEIFNCKSFEEV